MRPIRLHLARLLGLGLLLLAPGVARAQITLTPERVQDALARTDLRIETAVRFATAARMPQADLEVSAAQGLQAQARTEFAASHLRMALDLTLRARDHADRAIALLRGLPDPDRVLAQVDRTRETIERANDRLQDCDNDRARALLRVGTEMQGRAEAAVTESRYLAALQLTLSARERVFRALRLCNREENIGESAQRAVARTDEVLLRAGDLVAAHPDERSRAALEQARQLEDQARSQLAAARFEMALSITFDARAIAQRAIRLSNARP